MRALFEYVEELESITQLYWWDISYVGWLQVEYVIVGDVGWVFNGDVWSQWLVLDG